MHAFNRNGFVITQVLAAAMMALFTAAAISILIQSTATTERGVASNSELTQFANVMQSIFENKTLCSKSGLLGISIDPSPTPSPSPAPSTLTPVVIHLPGPNGPGDVFAQEGMRVGTTRLMNVLRFTSLVPMGSVSLGTQYFSTLHYETSVLGKSGSTRSGKGDFFLTLTLDTNNVVKECAGISNPVSPPQVACNSTWFPCIQNNKYLVATGDLKIYPSGPKCGGCTTGGMCGVHSQGTVACPSGWQPTGGGGECQMTANTWEAGVDVFGAPTGGGTTLTSKLKTLSGNTSGWFVDCCSMVRTELLANGQIYNGYQPATGIGAIFVTCVPEK